MSKAHDAGHRDARAGCGGRAAYPGAICGGLQRLAVAPFNRILLNVALDGALAAVATPLARWIADPSGGLLHPLWFLAGGAITLLVGGLPFRLPQQYWRFSGIEDLLGVAGAASSRRALFALLLVHRLSAADRRPSRSCTR